MEFIIYLIIVLIFAGFIYLVFKIFYNAITTTKQQHDNKLKYNAKKRASMKHISGLPLPINVYVEIYYNEDDIIFLKNNQEISIKTSKIIDMDVCTGKNLLSDVTSGAITGKLLFGGTTGATLGTIISTTIYFVISYKSNDENKTIILDTALSGTFANRLIKDFKSNYTSDTITKIDL